MSEIPKLPDHSGGDDDRKWLMDPNAQNNELAPIDNSDSDPGTELSTEVVDQSTEAAEDAENAEQKEAERLHKEIAHHYTSDIFKAARKIEKPVSNAMDVFGWSLEDQQRLLDALNGAANEDENAQAAASAETNADDTTSDPDNEVEGNSVTEETDNDDNAEADDDSNEGTDNSGAAVAAAATAAGVAAAAAVNERSNGAGGEEAEDDGGATEAELAAAQAEAEDINNSNRPESEKKKERSKLFKKIATRGIVIALALATVLGIGLSGKKDKKDVQEGTAIVQEMDEDQEENESIHDRSTYHGRFASEDGSTFNSNKKGIHNFGEPLGSGLTEDEMRQELGDCMIQPGQLAATYYYMQEKTSDPNFGVDGARFDNPDDLLEAMEADADLHQSVYDYVMSIFENSTFTEDTVTGRFHNFFMDSEFETGDSDTSNIEVVGCTTMEDGTKVYTVRRTWVDDQKQEHTDIFTFKEDCQGQPLDKFDFTTTVRQIPEDDDDTPEDDDDTPEDDDDDDEDDDDDDDDDDESKTPFKQDLVDEGDTPTVTPLDQDGTVSDKPTETADYNPDTNNDGSTGAEQNDVAPDSNTQTGAQDTNEQSADGSGQTVREVVDNAETNGGANGENTSNQENRTAEDQQQQQADQAGHEAQEQANNSEDRTAGQASESMTDEEAANAFMNGDF